MLGLYSRFLCCLFFQRPGRKNLATATAVSSVSDGAVRSDAARCRVVFVRARQQRAALFNPGHGHKRPIVQIVLECNWMELQRMGLSCSSSVSLSLCVCVCVCVCVLEL